jgi:hypothetical protein
VTARQQLERTEVRAPFNGIVSDRKVSAGDTAAVGKELVKVIDPTSLRFEGLVSADNIGTVAEGQRVWFRVHGEAPGPLAITLCRETGAPIATRTSVLVRGLRRCEATAERGGAVRRRACGNSQCRIAHSARRIGGARGRQRIRVASKK